MKKVTKIICLLCCCFAFGQKAANVFVFSGQSNMVGRGMIKDLPAKFQNNVANVFLFDLKSKTFQPFKNYNRFGPELSFIHEFKNMDTSGAPLYIIKYAKGGQALHHGVNSPQYVNEQYAPNRSNYYPGKNATDENRGTQYKSLQKIMDLAQKELKSKGIDATIDGFFWMQGEADCRYDTSSKNYKKNIESFYHRLEEDFETKDFPFVFGKVLPHKKHRELYQFIPVVHQQMEALHKEKNNFYMVVSPWDKMLTDYTHFESIGYVEIGQKMAFQYARIRGIEAKEPVYEVLEGPQGPVQSGPPRKPKKKKKGKNKRK